VLRELLDAGYAVRALSRTSALPGADARVEIVTGDLEHSGDFARALYGCRYVVHCAALYSFAPVDRARIHRVNVTGTAGLMEAARLAGIERFVLTSSSATLGASPGGRPRTEEDWASEGRASSYHHSKLEQERAGFAGRVPLIALLPTAPVGPGDWKPTPTGQMVLDFARGKIFAKPPRGGMNLVPVEDVARVHVAALERGRPGERYILGGENLTLDRIWELLAEVTGKPLPGWRAPQALALAIAYADEMRCRLDKRVQPFVPLEGVRMSCELMYADSSKAQRELGFSPGPVREALERAVQWYRANNYAA
jgi:dihydroflavonol-4-reductase